MKSAIARATMFVMGIFAYLILSIALYQNAWADDDANVYTVEFAKELMFNDETEWGVYYAVNASLNAILNTEAWGYTLTVNNGDLDESYAVYSAVYDKLYECSTNGSTAQDIAMNVIANTEDKTMHLGAAMYLYVARTCKDEIHALRLSASAGDTTS